MDKLFDALIKSAATAGEFSILVMLAGFLVAGTVIGILWKALSDALKRIEDLHEKNETLLREMLAQAQTFNHEKNRLVDEINKTLFLLATNMHGGKIPQVSDSDAKGA